MGIEVRDNVIRYVETGDLTVLGDDGRPRPPSLNEIHHLETIANCLGGNPCGQPIARRYMGKGGLVSETGLMLIGNSH